MGVFSGGITTGIAFIWGIVDAVRIFTGKVAYDAKGSLLKK